MSSVDRVSAIVTRSEWKHISSGEGISIDTRIHGPADYANLTESEHIGGSGEGSYRIHRLMRSGSVVVEALKRQ